MKRLLASALVFALAMSAPANVFAAGKAIAQTNGAISGTATVDGKPLGNVTVRLRNVDNGSLVGETKANAQGQFSFSGLGPGNFVVETIGPNGTILGTSPVIALTAAAMVATGIAVGTTGAAASAAGIGAAAVVGGGAAAGGLSTAATLAIIGGGVVAAGTGIALATGS